REQETADLAAERPPLTEIEAHPRTRLADRLDRGARLEIARRARRGTGRCAQVQRFVAERGGSSAGQQVGLEVHRELAGEVHLPVDGGDASDGERAATQLLDA